MSLITKIHTTITLALLVLCIGLGVAYSRQTKEIKQSEQTITELRKNVQIHTVTKIVRQPDGTTTTIVDNTKKSNEIQHSEKSSESSSKPALSRYAITAAIAPDLNKETIYVDVGARLGDLPLWLVVGSRPTQRELQLGVRLEF